MNKQIREFERASGLEIFGLGAKREKWEKAMEKFTELVVLECAEVLLKWKGEPFPFDENLAASLIKEHFDIK